MLLRSCFVRVLVAFALLMSSLIVCGADLQEIRSRGELRHLGIRYANFVTGSGEGFDVELVQGFDAEVLLRNDEGTEAEANSVIALLMLDSAKGRQIEIEATGPQEEEALAAVIALFIAGFDED